MGCHSKHDGSIMAPEIRDAYFTYLCIAGIAGRVKAISHVYHAVRNISIKVRASTPGYSVETHFINSNVLLFS